MEFKLPIRDDNSNKGTFGKVLNISGSKYMRGAAYLSSLAALKIGCGYVILCSEDDVLNSVSYLLPEVVLSPLKNLKNNLKTSDVILLGCGLSQTHKATSIVKTVLASKINKPLIIDADGLNILSKIKKIKLNESTVLTPHPKEASRLLNCELDKIISNPKDSALELSKKYECNIVLKGHNTVVCSNQQEIYINQTGNSALSKAGTGDILAGMIAGLIAQGLTPFEGAKTGVYLHGLAGELAGKELTNYSVLASELVRYFPNAIRMI